MSCVWHDLGGFVRNKHSNRAILYTTIYEGAGCIFFTIFTLDISPTTLGVGDILPYGCRDFCHVGISIK